MFAAARGLHTKADPIPIGADGHIIHLGGAQGANKGGSVDGAEVLSRDFVDITQGNGTHRGYITFNKRGNMKVAKFEGKVTTTMASDGTPNTSFTGNWTDVHGTGEYEKLVGRSGTYKGHFTSKTDYVVEWKD